MVNFFPRSLASLCLKIVVISIFEQDHKRQLDKARNGGSRERSR